MDKINLEEILFNSKFKDLSNIEKDQIRKGLISYEHEEILIAMKEACRQALKLAAENADFGICQNDNNCPCQWDSHFIDEQSIINVINSIK